MPPRDVRETIDLLRREAHQAGKDELAAMFTASLLRIDEEAAAARPTKEKKPR